MTEERQPTRFTVYRCEKCGFIRATGSGPCPIHGLKLERLVVERQPRLKDQPLEARRYLLRGTDPPVVAPAWIDCPDAEVCKSCPCAADDDACFPGERLRADLDKAREELKAANRRREIAARHLRLGVKKNERLQARLDKALAALREIRDKYGRVCPEFELCTHESCRSSYSAWHVADAALKALDGLREPA